MPKPNIRWRGRSYMTLQINGQPREFPDGLTVASLVAHLGMKTDRVAVELNLEIVPRSGWDATALHDGDKLEIVHFVGGGSGADPAYRILLFLTALYSA